MGKFEMMTVDLFVAVSSRGAVKYVMANQSQVSSHTAFKSVSQKSRVTIGSILEACIVLLCVMWELDVAI